MSGTYSNYLPSTGTRVRDKTSATHAGTVPIDSIDPPVGHIGYTQYVITGSHSSLVQR